MAVHKGRCGAYIDHVQKQVLFCERLAPVVRANGDHHRIAVSIPRIRILHTMPCL